MTYVMVFLVGIAVGVVGLMMWSWSETGFRDADEAVGGTKE